jgi:CDP-diacylglycerol--glycerol-3-phosphate 3-phosphatidyltransferase
MTITRTIGAAGEFILGGIVRLLLGLRVHPNVLTSIGLGINGVAAWFFARGEFRTAGVVVVCGAVFDLIDGRVARESNRVTRFGGFLDSVLDRYSDLILLMGLLVYYASINRFFYVVLTAVVMTGSVMISYTRARAENCIVSCKVGFLERPERIVLIIIGALANRMAPVLWVIAVLSNITVVHRIVHTWHETRKLDAAEHAEKQAKVPAESAQDKPGASPAETPPGELRESFPSTL